LIDKDVGVEQEAGDPSAQASAMESARSGRGGRGLECGFEVSGCVAQD